jgi:dienelactone hydrolase
MKMIVTLLFAAATPAVAQNAPAAAPAQAAAVSPAAAYVPHDTPMGTGAYKAIMEADPGLPTHTVYRPANLASANGKLPIIVWGNGACVNVGNRFRPFLTELASHGFMALAIGPIGPPEAEGAMSSSAVRGKPAASSPAAKLNPNGPKPDYIPADTTAAQLVDAIDWAVAENSRQGSKYYGKLDTTKIAVMGQSCGGLQAIDAAHDKRATVLGVWNSGLFQDAQRVMDIAAANGPKSSIKTLHTPAIYVTGDASDQAFKNADDDFDRIEGLPALRIWREKTPHAGTYREPNGGAFGPVAVAWLRWQLKGDQRAAKMFVGPDCGLCKQPEWHIRKKNID